MIQLRFFFFFFFNLFDLLCCLQREERVLGHIAIVTARCQWLRKKILQARDRQRQVRAVQQVHFISSEIREEDWCCHKIFIDMKHLQAVPDLQGQGKQYQTIS